ncbi:MAG: hypothetical protein V4598_07090 [Bdellovibrionota bacterium]
MKYLILFVLVSGQVFAADKLNDFNKKLMENFDKDIKTGNDVSVKKDRNPSRGPASVAPEIDTQNVKEEKKFEKSNQTGHRDW